LFGFLEPLLCIGFSIELIQMSFEDWLLAPVDCIVREFEKAVAEQRIHEFQPELICQQAISPHLHRVWDLICF
jgi:hypothetical protein